MTLIKVKCDVCRGSGLARGSKKREHFDDQCKACSGTGTMLVSVEEANALLTQKQIDDNKL